MRHLVLRFLRADARRLLSTAIAVALGVALLGGTLVLGDTLRANFDSLFTEALGRSDAVVRSANTLDVDGEYAQDVLDPTLADGLEAVDGVAAVSPRIEGFGQLTGSDGEKIGGFGPPTLAGSWIEDRALNPYRLVEGRAPRGEREVVINRGAARTGDLAVGDTTVLTSPEPVEVTIVGIATFGDADGLGPTTFTGFSLEDAQQYVLGGRDGVTEFLVRADDGVSQDALVRRLARVVPDGVEVIGGADLVAEANEDIDADFLGFLRTFLVVFAGVALLVATLGIANTFAVIEAQRRRAAALLRAIGADRRQIAALVIGQALLVGMVASVVGFVAGVLVAEGLKALFDLFGFGLPDGGLVIRPAAVVVSLVVGIGLTVLASLGAARRATRVLPVAALRDAEVGTTGVSRARVVFGALLLLGGVVAVVAGTRAGALAPAGLGAIATVTGTVLVAPRLVRPAVAPLGQTRVHGRGVARVLARRNAVRQPRRTAATASALLVGIGVVTLFGVFASSLKTSFADRTEAVVGGDLVVAASGFGGGGLSPGMVDAAAEDPAVARAVGLATGSVGIGDRTVTVTAVDPAASRGLVQPEVESGRPIADLDANQIAMTEDEADDAGLRVGDRVRLTFGDGAREVVELAGTYRSAPMFAGVVLPRATWDEHQVQTVDNLVVIGLRDGADAEAARRALDRRLAPFAAPDVQTRDEYVADAAAQIDQFLTMIYVMLALAIVIALMGIANTLSLSITERHRELGLLRAVGADRAQVRTMLRWEAVVIAALGSVGGLALGVFLGWGLVGAVAGAAGSIRFHAPGVLLVVIGVVGAAAGWLASIRPSRRAARLDVIEAVATP